MTDASKAREALLQSQEAVYQNRSDAIQRMALQQIARENPHAVIEVLLEDLMWRVFLEHLIEQADTPALDQIVETARQGDFDLAYQRTRLAFHLDRDRQTLIAAFNDALNRYLVRQD